jgi:hypothetical protein
MITRITEIYSTADKNYAFKVFTSDKNAKNSFEVVDKSFDGIVTKKQDWLKRMGEE